MRSRLFRGVLACIALAAIGLTLLSLFGNGLLMRIGEVRVSARSPSRPFFLAASALMLLAYASPRVRARVVRVRAAVEGHAVLVGWLLAGLLCITVVGLALRYGSFVASAADSYGYVTQADAFAGAPRVEPDPMARSLPWPNARWTVTPLGYVPGTAGRIVPVYPPGLPMLMAAFSLSAGHSALYLVVPVAAAGAILATFLLGLRVGGPGPGLGAALLLLSSPVFLFSACVPMSDVPAAALWTFAWLAALRGTPGGGLGAGLLAGAAVLVRPNLAPLAAPLLACLAFGWGTGRARSWSPPALFVVGVLPGLATLMVLNASRYGSPMALGYGPVASLFAAGYLGPNLQRFASWFLETQTLFVFVGLMTLVPAIARRVSGASRTEDAVRPLLLWVLTVVACYAFYLPFDNWGYLRFLLPAFPPLFVLAIIVTRAAFTRLPQPWDWLGVVCLVMLVALTTWHQAKVNDVFNNERSVRRFVDVPRFASGELAPEAIYLTRVYSGSMRYYGARRTLRWDVLEPEWLDQAINELLGRGLVPYIVIEVSDEGDLFRQRFASQEFGRLDWPPAAEYRGTERVHIYDPRDRARSRGGQSVETRLIPVSAQAIARR